MEAPMTYGDQTFRFRDEGFRDEPTYRPDNTSSTPTYRPDRYESEDYPAPTESTTTLGFSRRAVSPAELDDVFDDPQVGDPGMDRMAVHALWELVLLLATAGLAVWFYHTHRGGITGDGLRGLLLAGATLGFLTLAAGLSLRAGAVNLAVGPVAVASALYFAAHSGRGLAQTAAITLLLAAGVGVAIGLLTAAFHVPAWGTSLAGSFALIVWIQRHDAVKLHTTYQPSRHAFYWYGAFAALVLLGGFLGLVKPVRRGLGRFRPVGDPALRRGTGGSVVAVLALVGSCILAGIGGILWVLAGVALPGDGFAVTGLAVGAALLGGTSAFGRRGGIFGSLFAATFLALVINYSKVANLRISDYALAGGAIAAGLVVTRLIETYGRPASARPPVEDPEEPWVDPARLAEPAPPGYTAPRQGGWTSQLPARNNDDTWGGAIDDHWGAR
jgi:ribose/xylose/arabinose/galactoside ABC-type transport system permease subunit